MDWKDVRDNCERLGGDLHVIHSKEKEQKAMKGFNGYDHWIGLHSPQRNGVYQWVDESIPIYTNWMGKPDHSGGCVVTFTGSPMNYEWLTMDCGVTIRSICEI